MIIGGKDVIIAMPGRMRDESLWIAIRFLSPKWPDAIIEIDDDEALVYENETWYESIYRYGITKSNNIHLIHLIAQKDRITIVHHENEVIVEELRKHLTNTTESMR